MQSRAYNSWRVWLSSVCDTVRIQLVDNPRFFILTVPGVKMVEFAYVYRQATCANVITFFSHPVIHHGANLSNGRRGAAKHGLQGDQPDCDAVYPGDGQNDCAGKRLSDRRKVSSVLHYNRFLTSRRSSITNLPERYRRWEKRRTCRSFSGIRSELDKLMIGDAHG